MSLGEVMREIDPSWAWEPFNPDSDNEWTPRLGRHLLARTGLGTRSADLGHIMGLSPSEAVDWILERQESPDDVVASERLAHAVLASGDSRQLAATWVHRMLQTENPAQEKSVVFWHGHFATGAEKVDDARLVWNQNALLREHAHGSFADMVHGIAKDPAMLIYLDSESNRKAHPNENFARELMELFCLGEGHYSEEDVQELARCFTGWEVKRLQFRKNRYQQDRGKKTVLGESGEFDGEDGVDIVLQQSQVAPFIVGKLVRYYVCDEPEFSGAVIEPLAKQFRDGGYQVRPVLSTLFKSNLFFSDSAVAKKIKSPVDLAIGLMRTMEVTTNSNVLSEGMAKVGQGLFYPPNVKGWDGGRTWINSATLLGRANLVERLLNDENTLFGGKGLAEFFASKQVSKPEEVVSWLEKHLFALSPSESQKERVLKELKNEQGEKESNYRNALHMLCSLPEFQIG